MLVDDELKELIISQASTVALRKKAQEKGMRLLSEDGVNKVLEGITTVEEVARVCEEQADMRPVPQGETAALVEPAAKSAAGQERSIPREVKLQSTELQEYQKRIASWLGQKK